MNDLLSKLMNHTEHIVDAYTGLIQKYGLIHPMLFDEGIARKHVAQEKA